MENGGPGRHSSLLSFDYESRAYNKDLSFRSKNWWAGILVIISDAAHTVKSNRVNL